MKRMSGSALAVACGCLGASAVFAKPYQVETLSENTFFACPSCSLAAAESLAASKGAGTHEVYDLPGNAVYRLSCEPDGTTITCFGAAQTSGDNYNAFQAYRNLWQTHGSNEHFAFEVSVNIVSNVPNNPNGGRPDDGFINAFDTIHSSASLNGVIDNVISQEQFNDSIIYPNPGDHGTVNFSGSDETVTCVFHDGSKRSIHHDKGSNLWAAIPGTAKDADKNTLPETPPTSGYHTYTFGLPSAPYDSQNMYLLLAPSQLPPDGPGGNCGSESFDGQTVHCIHPY